MSYNLWPAPGLLVALIGLVGMLLSVLSKPGSRPFRVSSVIALVGVVGLFLGLAAAIIVGGVSS